jgi:hypothetical protein
VAAPLSGIPDWRDAGAYADLLSVERAGLAWEWLRRSGAYRQCWRDFGALACTNGQAARGPALAEAWGLHALEDPARPAPAARPIWRADRHPLVLAAVATAARDDVDTFRFERFGQRATVVGAPGAEHVLISDGFRSIRLDVAGDSVTHGPVRLCYRISGLGCASPKVLILRRLLHLAATGDFSRLLHRPDARVRRHVLLIRASDALAAGASQREIAAGLLGRPPSAVRWRIEAPSLRSQAQRLVRGARRMASGAWLDLLR